MGKATRTVHRRRWFESWRAQGSRSTLPSFRSECKACSFCDSDTRARVENEPSTTTPYLRDDGSELLVHPEMLMSTSSLEHRGSCYPTPSIHLLFTSAARQLYSRFTLFRRDDGIGEIHHSKADENHTSKRLFARGVVDLSDDDLQELGGLGPGDYSGNAEDWD